MKKGRIKSELYNDKTQQVKFMSKSSPYEKLADILGQDYINYRKKWVATSFGEDFLNYPLHLDISLNDSCNIKCHFCPHALPPAERGYKQTNDETIDVDLFEKIVKDGVERGLCSLTFGPFSESLLVENLEEYIIIAKNAGVIDQILYTNAHLLTCDRAKSLIKSGLTWINISIGATTKETYEKMRDYADFDKVIGNTLGFIQAREELNSELPMTRVSFLNTKQNNHELNEFVEFWQDKADVVSIQNLTNLHKQTKNSEQFMKEFYIEIEEQNDRTNKFCSHPFQRLLIRNNGDITPCCRFFGLNLVFGNIKTEKIQDVYNSAEMKKFRANVNTSNREKICALCLEANCEK